MNLVAVKPLDVWKSCAGLCMLCGMPLGLEPRGKRMKENTWDEDDKRKDDDHDGPSMEEEEEAALALRWNESLALQRQEEDMVVEENFVRVTLFKFGLLGSAESCHVIDQYTFLKEKDVFLRALQEHKAMITALGMDGLARPDLLFKLRE